MKIPAYYHRHLLILRAHAQKHAVLLILLSILSTIAIASHLSVARTIFTGGSGFSRPDSTQSCTSQNTIFADIESLDELSRIFREAASGVIEERLNYLKKPSEWVCPQPGLTDDPPMTELHSLASKLPGWSYEYQSTTNADETEIISKGIQFSTFSSILGELDREYECRLSELANNTVVVVAHNQDYPKGTKFCCAGDSCKASTPQTGCSGPEVEDPSCDKQCPIVVSTWDIATRSRAFQQRTINERTRARYALEKSFEILRSLELQYGTARDLLCFSRALLDLRSEFSLLADTTSCLPKIWDAVTSIHDRAP